MGRSLKGEMFGMGCGAWVSHDYLKRYPVTTPFLARFVDAQVLIATDKGLWRPEGRGYTNYPADAGRFSFEEAISCIHGLGPEKRAKIVLPDLDLEDDEDSHVYLVEVNATVEIAAETAQEAQERAAMLAHPLTYPEGVVTVSTARPQRSDGQYIF